MILNELRKQLAVTMRFLLLAFLRLLGGADVVVFLRLRRLASSDHWKRVETAGGRLEAVNRR